jgi:Protein of unknown function (DUF4238)
MVLKGGSRAMSEPVLQHYAPTSYLKRFTKSGSRRGDLFVFDRETGVWLPEPSTPKAEGKAPHLNTVEVASVKLYYVEKFFGVIEDDAAPVIRRVLEKEAFPESNEEFVHLMAFLSTLALRTPGYRALIRQVMPALLDQATAAGVSEGIRSQPEWGPLMEGVRLFFEGQLDNSTIESTPSQVVALIPQFCQAHWTLYVVDGKTQHFVTSDNPAAAGLEDVVIPLSPKIAVRSVGSTSRDVVRNPSQDMVDYINWRVYEKAVSRLFSDRKTEGFVEALLEYEERNRAHLPAEVDWRDPSLLKGTAPGRSARP